MKKFILSLLAISLFFILIFFYQVGFKKTETTTTTTKVNNSELMYGLNELKDAINIFQSSFKLSSEFDKNKQELVLEEKDDSFVYINDLANISIDLEKTLFNNDENSNFSLESDEYIIALLNGSQSGKDVSLIFFFSKDDYMYENEINREIEIDGNMFKCNEDWGEDYTYSASCAISKNNWYYTFEYLSYADKENVISVEDILLKKIHFLK